jgi:hypothetical protein
VSKGQALLHPPGMLGQLPTANVSSGLANSVSAAGCRAAGSVGVSRSRRAARPASTR